MNKKIFVFFLNYILLNIFYSNLLSCKVTEEGSAPSLVLDTPSVTPTPPPPTNLTKEQELDLMVAEFKTKYNVTFTFVPGFKPSSYMNGGSGGSTTTVGVCEYYSDGSKKVHMNEDWWPTASTLSKKILVYHELGHCAFNRNHNTNIFSGGRPYSIMYPILDPVVAYYSSNVAYYDNELSQFMGQSEIEWPVRFATNADGLCDESN